MVDPVASPDDVRGEAGISADESQIQTKLDDAAFENDRANGADSMDDGLRKQIEKKLAAYKLITRPGRDRSVRQKSIGSGSKSYERNVADELEGEIRRLDPSGELLEEPKREADFEVF